MPTILREGPYRFYFFSHEPGEPSHIHVDRENLSAKFWLEPVVLARNIGFNAVELRKIFNIVQQNQKLFTEAWYGYFGSRRR